MTQIFSNYHPKYFFELDAEKIPQTFPRIKAEEFDIPQSTIIDDLIAQIPPIPYGWEWTISETEFTEDKAVVRMTAKPKEEQQND